jgi:hypothetical protein
LIASKVSAPENFGLVHARDARARAVGIGFVLS